MNSHSILVTRPNHDSTTTYLYYWAGEILKMAQKKGFDTFDLAGKKANCERFWGVTKKTKPSLVFLNGHGNFDRVTGYDDETLICVDDQENLLEDKIVYALSCRSAKQLGKYLVKRGTKAYIGYDNDFAFIVEENKSTRPLNDYTAKLFLDPSNLVVSSLIKNNTTQEAFEKSQKAFKTNIRKYLTSASSLEDSDVVPYLIWDMKHQVCLGDKDAKIE